MAESHNSKPTNKKGEEAEQIAALLSADKFYPHYTYLNPKGVDGKEICDMLVLFKKEALIVQIKNNDDPYKLRNIEKNAKQCLGASRQILQSDNVLKLVNLTRREDEVNLAEISRTHLLALHFDQDRQINQYIFEYRKNKADKPFVHFMDDRSFKNILEELRTLPDFLNYLKDKEALIVKDTSILTGSEQDLIASWIFSGKSFSKMQPLNSFGNVLYYEDLIKDIEYIARKKDKIAKAFYWERNITELLGASQKYPDNYKVIANHATGHTLDERAELGINIKRIIEKMCENPNRSKSFNGCMFANRQNKLYVIDFTIPKERVVDAGKYRDYGDKLQLCSISYFAKWEEEYPKLKHEDKLLIGLGYLVDDINQETGNFRLLRCAAYFAEIEGQI